LQIIFRIKHQYPNAPHALGLLRERGERPRGRRIAEKGDELAPLHVPPENTPLNNAQNVALRDRVKGKKSHATSLNAAANQTNGLLISATQTSD
jgi:hypothetical protein